VIDHGEYTCRGRKRLEGLTALVTDADSGLGRAVALAFEAEGARVKAIESRAQSVEMMARELGLIHILVVNSAFEWLHYTDATDDVIELERAFRKGLENAFQLSLVAADHMAEDGSIIITAPMRYAHPVEPVRALAANTQAIGALAANLASTLAPKRIRANVLVPGPVCVPHVMERLSPQAAASFGSETLRGRPAQPAELVPAFVFLAAPAESAFVNGATLDVTGGAVAPLPPLK
jgi:NAD(P)-dependent dehydrogenase (short-subunit alcohol dehydrogenase family)